jgi:quinolinate synthase
VLTWALERGSKVLFFPDQHLGRNTGYELGFGAADMAVWDPRNELGGLEDVTVKQSTLLLWKGHCSVHQRFRPEHVAAFREAHPQGVVLAHPECAHEVVELADVVGSTDAIIRYVEQAPPGEVIGVATEIHLVHRLDNEHPELTVVSLDPLVCPCSTMFRIDAPHLCWVLEGLVGGEVRNRITVAPAVAAVSIRPTDKAVAERPQITTTERNTSPRCILAKASSTSPSPIVSLTKPSRSSRPCR